MLNKQAKVLSPKQQLQILDYVARSRYPVRDRVITLLSFKAGLRAVEIARLKWEMLYDAAGEIADAIALTNIAAKGRRGGRTIPMHPELREAIIALRVTRTAAQAAPERQVIFSERGGYSAASLVLWFRRVYGALGLVGASSHSGRRTFGTTAAKRIGAVGGSLRDVQYLLGHASLADTQRYIEGDSEAKRKVVALL